MTPDPWQSRAKCKDLSVEESDKLFFLGRGGSPIRAQEFCAKCPVQEECRKEAILYDEQGIWAGLTDDQRSYLAPHLKPVLLKEARLDRQLKEFDLPNVLPGSLPDSTQFPCCGAKHDGSCPNQMPPIRNWLETDENIEDIPLHEIDLGFEDRGLPNLPLDVLRLTG
jgi:hypothetical protein